MFAERVLKKLEKFGEEFVVDGNTYHGVFRVLAPPLDARHL